MKVVEILDRLRKAGTLHVVCHTESQMERLSALFSEHHLPVQRDVPPAVEGSLPPIFLNQGDLAGGFLLPSAGLSLITEEDIFAKRVRHRSPTRFKAQALLSSVEDLRVGDLIVHLHHGVGRYLGLKHLAISGFESDFLIIEYAAKDRLYLPLDRLDLVQNISAPRVHRPNWTIWAAPPDADKSPGQESGGKHGKELLDLYAAREV